MGVQSISETEIGEMLQKWQQGDIFELPGLSFIYVADPKTPLTEAAKEQAQEDLVQGREQSNLTLVETVAARFCVLSQTCDIVKNIASVPTLQIAPVITLESSRFSEVRRGSTSRFVYLPALDQEKQVADLDKIMTIEKAVLARCTSRKTATNSDQELKKLGNDIARKFSRFAFPDDYNSALHHLSTRVKEKHNKNTDEGSQYQKIKEIRVVPADEWSNSTVASELLFFVEDEKLIDKKFMKCIDELVKLFKIGGRFPEQPKHRCLLYKNLDADTYIRSFPLDLEYLSK